MEFEKVLTERFSCRKFKDANLTQEEINKILWAANIAPTAKNNQPWHIYVVQSFEGLKKVDDVTPCRYNAPVCMLVTSDRSKAFTKENGDNTYEMDASIVATHMMLEATNIGIDNIWVEMFDREKVKETFGIYTEPIMFLMLGHKEDGVEPSPNHNLRKEIKDMVSYI